MKTTATSFVTVACLFGSIIAAPTAKVTDDQTVNLEKRAGEVPDVIDEVLRALSLADKAFEPAGLGGPGIPGLEGLLGSPTAGGPGPNKDQLVGGVLNTLGTNGGNVPMPNNVIPGIMSSATGYAGDVFTEALRENQNLAVAPVAMPTPVGARPAGGLIPGTMSALARSAKRQVAADELETITDAATTLSQDLTEVIELLGPISVLIPELAEPSRQLIAAIEAFRQSASDVEVTLQDQASTLQLEQELEAELEALLGGMGNKDRD